MPSLFNAMIADQVAALIARARTEGHEITDPSMAQLESIIHAACWYCTSRPGSTANGFAWMELMEALKITSWDFAERLQN